MKKVKLDSFKNVVIGSRVHWYEYSTEMIIVNGGRGLVIDIFINEPEDAFSSGGVLFSILKDDSLEVVNFTWFDIQPVEELEEKK